MNTVITISGKTCSGKTYLLNQLLETGSYTKLITSTSRAPRDGEIAGVDYHFLTSSLAEFMINTNKFIESIYYGKHIYGLTELELETQLRSGKIPVVILTPPGVVEYRRLLAARGIRVVSIFIDCPHDLLISRLASRTAKEPELTAEVLKIAFERALTAYENERDWLTFTKWDKVISGGDGAFDELSQFLKQF